MKPYFICLSGFILLFSNCSRSGYVIKKRYSKGFYTAHSAKNKCSTISFTLTDEDPRGSNEIIVKRGSDHTFNSFREGSLHERSLISSTRFESFTLGIKRSTSTVKDKVSKSKKSSYGRDTTSIVVSIAAILAALALILAMVKTFGLMFIIPVCIVITFTAVAIFFMIRDHVKD